MRRHGDPTRARSLAPLLALLLLPGLPSRADIPEEIVPVRAPYVPTPHVVVERMLDMAAVGEGDVVYDLGCGDGRIVIAAARRGARATGVDIDPELLERSRAGAKEAGVEDRVRFIEGDLFDLDISDATVVTLFLLPDLNLLLRPRLLAKLAPGSRVVSHAFDMWDWRADKIVVVEDSERGYTLYHWIIPARVGGTWRWQSTWESRRERTFVLDLTQTFQRLRGSLDVGRRRYPIRDAGVRGNFVFFAIDGPNGQELRFEGSLQDGRLVGRLGEMEVDAWLAPREE